MWTEWKCIDEDCFQYIRKNGNEFEMIQTLWLDKENPYIIVRGCINLTDYSKEEKQEYLDIYDYDINSPLMDDWLIAECILEQNVMSEDCIVDKADTFEEAKKKIKKFEKTLDIR